MSEQVLWVDVTRTMCWHGNPVGIMRVEFEMARYYLTSPTKMTVKFFAYCFMTHQSYEVIPADVATKLKSLEQSSKAPSRKTGFQKSVDKFFKFIFIHKLQRFTYKKIKSTKAILENLRLIYQKKARFSHGEMLLMAGPIWTYPGMVEWLQRLKSKTQVCIAIFIYDLIPILYEHLSSLGAKKQHVEYYKGMFDIVGLYFCISKQTENDFVDYASRFGRKVNTQIIYLGADFNASKHTSDSDEKQLNELGIQQPYILCVSTVEVRKNHGLLYKTYQLLLEEGHTDIPLMVWVGKPGWGTQDLLKELSLNSRMKKKIIILHHVSDNLLHRLYQHCLYTVYPSFYEGWGLPVAESLSYGKYCLSSSAASLPEVGQDLTMLLSPYDTRAWADAILQLQDATYLEQRTHRVEQCYQPTTWQIAGKVLDDTLKCSTNLT